MKWIDGGVVTEGYTLLMSGNKMVGGETDIAIG